MWLFLFASSEAKEEEEADGVISGQGGDERRIEGLSLLTYYDAILGQRGKRPKR